MTHASLMIRSEVRILEKLVSLLSSESSAHSEKVNSDVFGVCLGFADSLFIVPCYSNTVTVRYS